MRKILLMSILIILIMPSLFAYICQDETDVDDIPCDIITPIIPVANDCNITIRFTAFPNVNYTFNGSLLVDGTYNATFNYTNLTSYSIVACDNSTSTMEVGHLDDDYNDKWLWFYGGSLLLGAGLMSFGFWKKDNIITLLAGFVFIAFAIVFITEGYPSLDDLYMRLSIILISLGAGLYITAQSSLHLIQEGL